MPAHFKLCLKFPLECSFCLQEFPRKDLDKHRQKCFIDKIPCKHCQTQTTRGVLAHHYSVCEEFPTQCESKHCFKVTPRRLEQDHARKCIHIREVCKGLCGMLVKRRYLTQTQSLTDGEWSHDCVKYLTEKVEWSKQKSQLRKENSKYSNDLHKAFCKGCDECAGAYRYLPVRATDEIDFEQAILASFERGLSNLAFTCIATGYTDLKFNKVEEVKEICLSEIFESGVAPEAVKKIEAKVPEMIIEQ